MTKFILSLALLLTSLTAFAGSETTPASFDEAPTVAEAMVPVDGFMGEVSIDAVTFACTISGTFTTSGGDTYEVTVTAPSCGGAARVLQAVGDAIDEL